MKQERRDIERLFQEAFRGYEQPVSDSDWNFIEQALPAERKRPKALWPFLLPLPIAAIIALFWCLQNPDAVNQNNKQETANRQRVTSELPSDSYVSTAERTGTLLKSESRTASRFGTNRTLLERSAYRRTDAGVSRVGNESESQKYSGTGSNSLGGSTGQINDELREFKGELPVLSGRKFDKFNLHHPISRVKLHHTGPYQKAMDAWRKARKPGFWISSSFQSMTVAAADVKNIEEWKGKSLVRNRLQGGLVQQVAAGINLSSGLTSIQFGMGESQTLNPMKQHWTMKTRMVTDSIPYRNLPGDTLFWIPVRFTDTLVDVVTDFSERRLIIPFRINQNIPICAKFGLNFQVGGQLGILQSMKATIPSPYTDYTWTQVRSGMAGKAQTNAPLASAEADKAIRTRMDMQFGTGGYWRFSRNLMISGNMLVSKSLNPLMRGNSKYHQYGGQITLYYQW